jgi:hypothetical protein
MPNEQLQPFEIQREALVEKLKLREQYETQVKTLNETGILEILPESQELGIVGIDGKPYPVPKYEEVLQRITPEKIELFTKKFEQGFTQLLLVPFGMALDTLIDRYRRELLRHNQEGTLFSPEGQRIDLDEKSPIYTSSEYKNADISGELVYNPSEFSQKHQGRIKAEIIREKGPWQIIFVEDLPELPGEGRGQTIKGRCQLEASKTSDDYLRLMREDPQYVGEQGFNPEDWLTLAITTIHQKNYIIENRQSQVKVSFLISSYFKSIHKVPHALWIQFKIYPFFQSVLEEADPFFANPNYSARSKFEI